MTDYGKASITWRFSRNSDYSDPVDKITRNHTTTPERLLHTEYNVAAATTLIAKASALTTTVGGTMLIHNRTSTASEGMVVSYADDTGTAREVHVPEGAWAYVPSLDVTNATGADIVATPETNAAEIEVWVTFS